MNAAAPTQESGDDPGAVVLELGVRLEIDNVEAERVRLLQILSASSSIIVDAGQIRQMDTAGVQLLLAFKLEAARRDVRIRYRNGPVLMTRALRLLGLNDSALST